MNNRRLLIAAEFHFVHPVEKEVRGQRSVSSQNFNFAAHKHNIFHMNLRNKLEPAII